MTRASQPRPGERYQHVARGTIYDVLDVGKTQGIGDDYTDVVIYREAKYPHMRQQVWVRPVAEFMEPSRFKRLPWVMSDEEWAHAYIDMMKPQWEAQEQERLLSQHPAVAVEEHVLAQLPSALPDCAVERNVQAPRALGAPYGQPLGRSTSASAETFSGTSPVHGPRRFVVELDDVGGVIRSYPSDDLTRLHRNDRPIAETLVVEERSSYKHTPDTQAELPLAEE